MQVKSMIAGQRVVTARLEDDLHVVAELMKEHRITGVPIVDEWGALAGLVTIGMLVDLAGGAPSVDAISVEEVWSPAAGTWTIAQVNHEPTPSWRSLRARDVMRTDIATVAADADVRDAARHMLNRSVHRLIVLDPARNVCGVLSALDYVTVFAEHLDDMAGVRPVAIESGELVAPGNCCAVPRPRR